MKIKSFIMLSINSPILKLDKKMEFYDCGRYNHSGNIVCDKLLLDCVMFCNWGSDEDH